MGRKYKVVVRDGAARRVRVWSGAGGLIIVGAAVLVFVVVCMLAGMR